MWEEGKMQSSGCVALATLARNPRRHRLVELTVWNIGLYDDYGRFENRTAASHCCICYPTYQMTQIASIQADM
jgi:hypothetical protein